jgi:hypothetical protein
MKKQQLPEVDFSLEFALAGIVSTERPYKLAWRLNQILPSKLSMQDDIVFYQNNEPLVMFTRFEGLDAINRIIYTVLENRSDGHYLLPELKTVDFLLIVTGALEYFDMSETIQTIKHINEVQWISEIAPSRLKSKNNLILPESYVNQQFKKLLA